MLMLPNANERLLFDVQSIAINMLALGCNTAALVSSVSSQCAARQ
jgi:hypothetical protein